MGNKPRSTTMLLRARFSLSRNWVYPMYIRGLLDKNRQGVNMLEIFQSIDDFRSLLLYIQK